MAGLMKLAARVKETTQSTGLGAFTLDGASPGAFRTFVQGIGDGNKCRYIVCDNVNWEESEGAVTDAAQDTLSRDAFIASSTGAAINWGPGGKDIWLIHPASLVGPVLLQREIIASPVAQVDFLGIDGTYRSLRLGWYDVVPSSAGTILNFRVSIGGAFKTDANYLRIMADLASGTLAAAGTNYLAGTDTRLFTGVGGQSTAAGYATSGFLTVQNPGVAGKYKKFFGQSEYLRSDNTTHEHVLIMGSQYVGATGALDGLRASYDTGNIAGGVLELWGIP